MTILHICNFENKMSNGATVAAINHINAQAKYGDNTIMVLYLRNEPVAWEPSVRVIHTEDLDAMFSDIDLAVFHEIYYFPYFDLAKRLKKGQVPYVVLAHGGLTQGAQAQKKWAKRVVNLLWVKTFIANAAAVQFLSEKEKSSSVNYAPKAIVSPNGVYIPDEQKQYIRDNESFVMTYIGRINIFYKGLDLLMEACSLIKNDMRKNNIRLNIYGPKEGEDVKKVGMLIDEYQIADIVCLHPPVFGEEKECILRASDIFIQPSRSEGMPMGILEAMAIGLPVLLTPGTSFGDAVINEKCGCLVECDAPSIAKGILEVYENRSELPEMSQRAVAYVRDNFEWKTVAVSTMEKYSELI